MTKKELNRLAREVSEKKRYLSARLATTVDNIAQGCLPLLHSPQKLDTHLKEAIKSLPDCMMIYVSDPHYRQLSSNITPGAVATEYRNQDLSKRPYLQNTIPLKGLILSSSYLDTHTNKSCISLVQAIQQDDRLLGLVIADFNMDSLPVHNDVTRMMSNWQQFKGDPAIRGSLFTQQRIGSYLDTHINRVHEVIEDLMINNGVFHFKLHYSSSRVTLWLYDRPHHYRVHTIDELLNGVLADDYPRRPYPVDACVDYGQIEIVLNQFRELRFADENVYLRSGSLNIINGMVGLNFSCDGSHYMPVKEFIDNSMDYWLGTLQSA